MSTGARVAVGCVVGLVAAAGGVLVYEDTRDTAPVAVGEVTPGTPESRTASPSTTPTRGRTTPPTTTPSPRSLAGPAPLTVEASQALLPQAGAEFVAAEVPVELSSVCEGAAPDLTSATPLYASLQSSAAPLRFLDVAVGVYAKSEDAARAYDRLTEDVAACPPSRSATPAAGPGPSDAVPPPILVEGERRDVVVAERPAIQWVQVQTVQSPATQLRTAVTVTRVHNALVMVSVDADSETADAIAIASDSLTHADAVAAALAGLVG
jgi:hypothetical protein